MVALKQFRAKGPSFSDLVPYAGMVDNGVLLLKDGSLMSAWYFAGPDLESATDQERNELSRQINAVLSRLGSGWMIQVEAIRIPTVDYPSQERCHFPDPVTRAIDAERRMHFARDNGHFESKHALVLTYRPPESRKAVLSKYIYSDEESRKKSYADTVLIAFKNAVREVEQYFANTYPCTECEPAPSPIEAAHEQPTMTNSFSSPGFALPAKTIQSASQTSRCIWTGSRRPSFSTG